MREWTIILASGQVDMSILSIYSMSHLKTSENVSSRATYWTRMNHSDYLIREEISLQYALYYFLRGMAKYEVSINTLRHQVI